MRLTKMFSDEEYAEALGSWDFVELAGKDPSFTSLFGDVFLRGHDGWWYLDMIRGTLRREWDSQEAMLAELDTDAGRADYLRGPLAEAAAGRGLTLGEADVYDLMPPPILGGTLEPEHVVTYPFVVSVNLNGQLHAQVRSLAPDTSISEITFTDGPQ